MLWLGHIGVWWFCGEDEHVSVRIANTHLPCSPGLIRRWQLDYRTACGKFLVQPIHINNPKKGIGHSSPLRLIRLKMKPDAIPSDTEVAWVRLGGVGRVGKHFLKSQDFAVIVFGSGRIRNGNDRNGAGYHDLG